MASLAKERGDCWRVLFVDPQNGKRRTVRLGPANKEQRQRVLDMVNSLVKAKATGTSDAVALAWLNGLPDRSYRRFVKVGLAEPRKATEPTPEQPQHAIGEFLDNYIKSRVDIKPQSLVVLGHTVRNLKDFFGADRPLNSISEGNADAWRLYLIGQGLSPATVNRRSGFAKQLFKSAVRHKLIPSNVFADLKSGAKANEERMYYVSREDTQKVVESCTDNQWRLLVALARFGGLRTPSESLLLRWQDIDWEKGRIHITSPKTEHVGKGSRVIPLFPELVKPLQDVFEEAEPRAVYCITRYRLSTCNLRTELQRIIKRAGLEPWPRLWQNLRSSCETELAKTFPLHVVTAWLGNTPKIAQKHYLQIREEDFDRAVTGNMDPEKSAQKAAQLEADSSRQNSSAENDTVVVGAETGFDELGQVPTESPVDRVGFEPT